MEGKRRRPWHMLVPLIAVIAIAVLWSVYWAVASTAIKNAYAKAEKEGAAQRILLACKESAWTGFPFRAERSCVEPRLSIDLPQRHFDISASNLLLAVQVYDPRHAIALLDGPTLIDGAGSEKIDHGRALASFRLGSDDSWQASLELPKLVVPHIGSADRLLLHARAADQNSDDLALSAEKLDLALANGKRLPIDNFSLTATVPEAALHGDIRRYLSTTGQQIEVTGISAQRGELTITGSGTIGLDRDGYPIGRIPTRINRPDLLFEIVRDVADLPENDLAAAQTLVDLLQKNASGSDPQLDLIARNRKLYWGPFKLADLVPFL